MKMTNELAALALLLAASQVQASPGWVEAGTPHYLVNIDDELLINRHTQVGYFAVYTGPDHPVSMALGGPAAVVAYGPACTACGGPSDSNFMSIRSYGSLRDYVLGRAIIFHLAEQPDPPFECFEVNQLAGFAQPRVELVDGEPRRVVAAWSIRDGADELDIVEALTVHGEGWMDSWVELSLAVANVSAESAIVGARRLEHLGLRNSWVRNPARVQATRLAFRPPDPPAESDFSVSESESQSPSARAWEAWGLELNSMRPLDPYRVMGVMQSRTGLEPALTPPDLLQHAAFDGPPGTEPLPGGGLSNTCFRWTAPRPLRPLGEVFEAGVATTWGDTEATAVVIPPGGTHVFRQALVAFRTYPIAVDVGPEQVVECTGSDVTLNLAATVSLVEPTTAPLRYRWWTEDAGVTIHEPDVPDTTVTFADPGEFRVHFAAGIGAFEAETTALVRVVDSTPPDLRVVRVTPDSLWPPNHRMVPVHVELAVEDACDPAPSVRLVSVESSEPDDARGGGDGRTVRDVQGAEPGTDDRDVLLRAERQGGGAGRRYLLTYEATDSSGNTTTRTAIVRVPHDARDRPAWGLRVP